MIAAALLSLAAWVYLLALRGRFWLSGPELRAASPVRPAGKTHRVAAIVPARDEAEHVAASIGSLLRQEFPALEVVLVDDGSTDATAAIARAAGRADDGAGEGGARLIVVEGAPRPPGWAGKLWAVQQGIAATDAPWLLLTDADIVHDPRHLATLMAWAEAERRDMVSEMVALRCMSLAERALIPAFVYFFQLLYPFAWVNDPGRRLAAAAGGTVLISRAALERAGGIAAIRGALIDDVALAGAVKRTGGVIWIGHTRLAKSIRPYPAARDVWRMVARSAYVQLRCSPALLLGMLLGLTLVFLVPPLGALFGVWSGRHVAVLAWMLMALSYAPTLARYGRSPLWAPALPLVALFYMAATISAALDHHRGRGVVWKQRAYTEGKT